MRGSRNRLLCILFLDSALLLGQFRTRPAGPLAHTYSIVARDPATGEMGVAVQSHWFSVGSAVSWAEAGAGAIATQSFVNVSFGPRGLELLRQGKTAQEVVRLLIDADDGRDYRQLAVVDAKGNVAVHTGKKCIRDAGHRTGVQSSCQANMMLNGKVWDSMALAYEKAEGPLAERLIAALEAGQETGGDIRGKQSSAILIVKPHASDRPWEDRLMDLRVEDHPEPVRELKRLVRIHRAYAHMNAGDLAVEKNDVNTALEEYRSAEALFPGNLEMKYWHAVSLANTGMLDQAMPIFRDVFSRDENWRLLTQRLPDSGLLTISKKDLKMVLNVR